MANDAHSTDGPRFDRHVSTSFRDSDLGRVLYTGLEALASLKFTVVLFALAILLILFGTLAQTESDIYVVLKEHFHPWLTWFPARILMPESFFPNRPDVEWRFPFPGGAAIGAAMFINLFAAHSIRFKIQSKGSRLWGGIGVIGLGALITYMVIRSGSNPNGFQAEAMISWDVLWQCLKFGAGALWVGLASTLLRIERERRLERWFVVAVTLTTGAFLVYLFLKGDELQLDDSSMRILWQLIKGLAAAGVLLVGCIMVFKKRGGIVLLHGGIGLMMFSELFVTMKVQENQMGIMEGQTVNWMHDGRHSELAIIDRSGKDEDRVVIVPASRLLALKGKEKRLTEETLPFEIQVIQYYENSTLSIRHDANRKGAFKYREMAERAKGVGTESESEFDTPSAILELYNRETGKSAGRFLVSVRPELGPQQVRVGGKVYEIDFRFKRSYRPYSVHLIDVKADQYYATGIPKNYSSDLQFVDPGRKIANETRRTWMNNPVRYAGETFYQHQVHQVPIFRPHVDPATGLKTGITPDPVAETAMYREHQIGIREKTILSVVTNQGWMIPYVACMIVATGMMAHFWLILLRFLNRRAAGSIPTGATLGSASAGQSSPSVQKPGRNKSETLPATSDGSSGISDLLNQNKAVVWFPLAIGVLFTGWLLGKSIVRSPGAEEFNYYEFGKLPLVSSARPKPLDSYARNTLRAISHKEEANDGKGVKRDAIVWLLDVIADPDKAAKYRVFRIENLEVLSLLKLPKREGYRYTLNEVIAGDNLRTIVKYANEGRERLRADKTASFLQSKFISIEQKLGRYESIIQAFMVPPSDVKDSASEFIQAIIRYKESLKRRPLAGADPDSEEKPWVPLSNPAALYWGRELAKANGGKSWNDLYQHIMQAPRDSATQDELERRAKSKVHEMVPPNLSAERRAAIVEQQWGQARPAQREALIRGVVSESLRKLTAKAKFEGETPPHVVAMIRVLQAAKEKDAAEFNKRVVEYKNLLSDNPPNKYESGKVAYESWLNHLAPYYRAAILYLVAFVLSALAWLGWSRPLNRAAFVLVVIACIVQTVSLISRMYISGRWGVTVTNLYSSAIFIGWAACLFGIALEVVYRIGIGNLVASVAGFSTLLIAHFLSFDGDTIAVMQAVLDTNFWLATHVTTITLGYSATFVAGLLGLRYVIGGLCSRSLTNETGKILSRMIYGTLCFAIFFSFVGTVLGGLWADDSWGRFWGWDPKENGALIIVLWNALVLHARWGRLVGDRGTAVLAIGGNIVTAWSWFGVNLLGIGLHSYGFKDGTLYWLGLWCGVNLAIVIVGACVPKDVWWSFRAQSTQA